MNKITKKMILGNLIIKYPETIDVFIEHGLPCATCQLASKETVEQAAKSHGIKVETLLKDLNKAIKKK